jgi:hypothetical protein
MPIMATAGDSTTYTPAPEGVHQAVCVDVIDLGIIPGFEVKPQHKIDVVWQIAELRDDGKRYELYKRYTLSIHEKATLCADLVSWRGKAFTAAEAEAFDVETIKGANCLINVHHKASKDGKKTYANVVAVMPLLKNMPKMAADGYTRREKKNGAESTPDGFPASELPPAAPLTDDDIPF